MGSLLSNACLICAEIFPHIWYEKCLMNIEKHTLSFIICFPLCPRQCSKTRQSNKQYKNETKRKKTPHIFGLCWRESNYYLKTFQGKNNQQFILLAPITWKGKVLYKRIPSNKSRRNGREYHCFVTQNERQDPENKHKWWPSRQKVRENVVWLDQANANWSHWWNL